MPQPVKTRGLVCRARRVAGVQPLRTLLNPLPSAGTAMLSKSVVRASPVSRSGSPICGLLH